MLLDRHSNFLQLATMQQLIVARTASRVLLSEHSFSAMFGGCYQQLFVHVHVCVHVPHTLATATI